MLTTVTSRIIEFWLICYLKRSWYAWLAAPTLPNCSIDGAHTAKLKERPKVTNSRCKCSSTRFRGLSRPKSQKFQIIRKRSVTRNRKLMNLRIDLTCSNKSGSNTWKPTTKSLEMSLPRPTQRSKSTSWTSPPSFPQLNSGSQNTLMSSLG